MKKLQAPTSKLQRNTKLQIADEFPSISGLRFGVGSFFGIWNLELGASSA
jgi:hypothetical protein